MDIKTFNVDTISDVSLADLGVVDGLPLVLHVDQGSEKSVDFVSRTAETINRLVDLNGALLIRGLKVYGSKDFASVLSGIFGEELLQYTYRSTPRTELKGNIYTATEYPASESIPQHNENSYSRCWPLRIGFLCLIPAQVGGATPISCSQRAYELLPPELVSEFEAKQIMYVRNYLDLDLPWTEVFQTQDKAEVEEYCKSFDIQFEWGSNGLRTKQFNQATAIHPLTKRKIWFNQAHLFHVSNLPPEIRETLLNSVGEENLPRNTYFGDGTPIPTKYLDCIRDVYERSKLRFEWQKSDLLILDNMRFTHGRDPFSGDRKVLVGMAHPNC